jgi:hypothetical protein
MYSESTREVRRLELCLEAVKTALAASEEETNAAQARTAEADARVAGKISFLEENLFLYSQLLF